MWTRTSDEAMLLIYLGIPTSTIIGSYYGNPVVVALLSAVLCVLVAEALEPLFARRVAIRLLCRACSKLEPNTIYKTQVPRNLNARTLSFKLNTKLAGSFAVFQKDDVTVIQRIA